MNSKFVDILKEKSYVVPGYLLSRYKRLNMSSDEVLLIVYLMSEESNILDYQKISECLSFTIQEIVMMISSLKDKKLIEINMKKNSDSKIEEQICLDLFYNKLFMSLIDVGEEKKDTNIYTLFEHEFGRTLSPIEYELVNGWLETGYKQEIIELALKEAVFNGVNSFKYIDRILFDWNKKGINTPELVEKNKKNFKKKEVPEVPDYDWLSNE